MARRIFQQVPTPMDIDASGITSAARQMSVVEMDQVIFVRGDGAPIIVSASPQIEAHEITGAVITIIGMDATNTLELNSGPGVILSARAVLGLNCILELIWCGDNYIELGRNF